MVGAIVVYSTIRPSANLAKFRGWPMGDATFCLFEYQKYILVTFESSMVALLAARSTAVAYIFSAQANIGLDQTFE